MARRSLAAAALGSLGVKGKSRGAGNSATTVLMARSRNPKSLRRALYGNYCMMDPRREPPPRAELLAPVPVEFDAVYLTRTKPRGSLVLRTTEPSPSFAAVPVDSRTPQAHAPFQAVPHALYSSAKFPFPNTLDALIQH